MSDEHTSPDIEVLRDAVIEEWNDTPMDAVDWSNVLSYLNKRNWFLVEGRDLGFNAVQRGFIRACAVSREIQLAEELKRATLQNDWLSVTDRAGYALTARQIIEIIDRLDR